MCGTAENGSFICFNIGRKTGHARHFKKRYFCSLLKLLEAEELYRIARVVNAIPAAI
jgi:hypothetical protein